MRRFIWLTVLTTICNIPAQATRPWTDAELAQPLGPAVTPRVSSWLPASAYDADEVFGKACAFIAAWQVTDPNDPDYGGIREGENMPNIIQTDNTQESVWIWSRWRELTGSRQYDEATARSWVYIIKNPAWEEEGWGSESQKYYRYYNCGWGMRAEMMYRRATGDDSYKGYGKTCAQFVVDNANNINITAYLTNFLCFAWAVGNLYAYAEDIGDENLKASAVNLAAQIKSLAEAAPQLRIGYYTWAVSGGATIWGLHESYFREHPSEEKDWMTTYAAYLPELVPPGSNTWDNAWNAWFMLGHYVAYHATGDESYWTKFDNVAGNLVAQDTDDDGGIPPSQAWNDDADHTWVTSYLCFMGMDRIIRDLSVAELEAKAVTGAIAVSWEPADEFPAYGYNIYREHVGFPGNPKINETLLTSPPYEFEDTHIVPSETYKYTVEAVSRTGHNRLAGPTTCTAGVWPMSFALASCYPNPSDGHTTVEFSLPARGEATFAVYDLAGREVWRHKGKYSAGKHILPLSLNLPAGVYIYELAAGEDTAVGRMVISK